MKPDVSQGQVWAMGKERYLVAKVDISQEGKELFTMISLVNANRYYEPMPIEQLGHDVDDDGWVYHSNIAKWDLCQCK